MQVIIALTAVFAVALAKPGFIAAPLAAIATPVLAGAVSSQFHAQDELGQYHYGYSNGLSSKSEIKTADGITQGGYSYVDSDGKLQNVQYTADAVNGFRVAASNLPVAPAPLAIVPLEAPVQVQDTPEVVEAKARHFEAVKEAEALIAATPAEQEEPIVKAAAPVVESVEESAPLSVAPIVAAPELPAPIAYSAAPATGYSYTTYNHFAAPAFHGYSAPAYQAYSAPAYQAYAAPAYQAYAAPAYHTFGAPAYHHGYVAPAFQAYAAAPAYYQQLAHIPSVPADTAEVAQAKAEHFAAHAKAAAQL